MEPRVWYVGFWDPHDGGGWWWRLTRPGFRHCAAFGYVQNRRCWLLADWSRTGLSLMALDGQSVDAMVVGILAGQGTIIEVTTPPRDLKGPPWPRLPFYCVTMVKHLLGIRSPAASPWQLFCALQKSGARETFIAAKNELRAAAQAKARGETP